MPADVPRDDFKGFAKSRYEALRTTRQNFLSEAAKSARLTLPRIMPREHDVREAVNDRFQDLEKPFQSLGARGVNNLASKLSLTLFPPTAPFFRYEIDPGAFDGLNRQEQATARTELQELLSRRERQIVKMLDVEGLRPKLFLSIEHQLITGNALLYMAPDGPAQFFPLSAFVVKRDGEGNWIELVYVEILDRKTVSETIREMLVAGEAAKDSSGAKQTDESRKTVEVYTYVERKGNRYEFHQELADGQVVPGTEGSAPVDDSPWLVLRYSAVDGEDYGRGFVEDYRGDLASYETLSKALQFGAVNAAKLVVLVSPNGSVSVRELNEADNGEAIVGEEQDVTFLRLDKSADFQFALTMWQDIRRQLSADFMLNSSIQRQGERVTAEEIRTLASELEDSLGGAFSIQSQELQLPLVRRLESSLVRRGSIPELPDGDDGKPLVLPTIVTGLAAIGRGQDIQRLRETLALIAEAESVRPGVAQWIDAEEIARRIIIGTGVEEVGLLRSKEEIQQENTAARQAQIAQTVLEKSAGPAAGPIAEQAVESGGLQNLAQGLQGGGQPPQQ